MASHEWLDEDFLVQSTMSLALEVLKVIRETNRGATWDPFNGSRNNYFRSKKSINETPQRHSYPEFRAREGCVSQIWFAEACNAKLGALGITEAFWLGKDEWLGNEENPGGGATCKVKDIFIPAHLEWSILGHAEIPIISVELVGDKCGKRCDGIHANSIRDSTEKQSKGQTLISFSKTPNSITQTPSCLVKF